MFLSAKRFVLRVAVFFIDLVVYAAMKIYPLRVYREIASNVRISGEWTEIIPLSPMKINRRFQLIGLHVYGAYIPIESHEDGFYLPDGVEVRPEVRISDTNGNWYSLEGGGFTLGEGGGEFQNISRADYKAYPNLPQDKQFRSIRLRSETPFVCRKIVWQNYDLK